VIQDFNMISQDYADRIFLALMIWREARGEERQVQVGIAHVVLNRVKSPSWWGNDIQSVIFKKWQFSSLTDPSDRQLTTWPASHEWSWNQCLDVAFKVMDEQESNPVPGADSYYDISIPAPRWATKETFVKQLGKVRFYNLDRDVEK